ncbi:hypothetical protein LINPERHAP1_LOCUS5965, partial [Linum perenne]
QITLPLQDRKSPVSLSSSLLSSSRLSEPKHFSYSVFLPNWWSASPSLLSPSGGRRPMGIFDSLLNYQTVITDLTGIPMSNAS